MKTLLIFILAICLSVGLNAQKTPDSLKQDKLLPYGMIAVTTKYSQIPLTPIYVCWGKRHGRPRVIIRRWYIPYLIGPKNVNH